jgi:Fe-S cluster biogenesis protein NfuA
MADGGNVEFVEIDGLVVRLKLAGACGSCPSSLTTMTMGIKRRLMEKIPVSGAASTCAAGSWHAARFELRWAPK